MPCSHGALLESGQLASLTTPDKPAWKGRGAASSPASPSAVKQQQALASRSVVLTQHLSTGDTVMGLVSLQGKLQGSPSEKRSVPGSFDPGPQMVISPNPPQQAVNGKSEAVVAAQIFKPSKAGKIFLGLALLAPSYQLLLSQGWQGHSPHTQPLPLGFTRSQEPFTLPGLGSRKC